MPDNNAMVSRMRRWSRTRCSWVSTGKRSWRASPTRARAEEEWQSYWSKSLRLGGMSNQEKHMKQNSLNQDQEILHPTIDMRKRRDRDKLMAHLVKASNRLLNLIRRMLRQSITSSPGWPMKEIREWRLVTPARPPEAEPAQDLRVIRRWLMLRRRSSKPTEWNPRTPFHLNKQRKTIEQSCTIHLIIDHKNEKAEIVWIMHCKYAKPLSFKLK